MDNWRIDPTTVWCCARAREEREGAWCCARAREERERERAGGLEHVMQDGGCHVGPTRIGSERGIWVSTQI